MKLKEHQKDLANKILSSINSNQRTLFCGACAIGKTVLTLHMVRKWVKEGKRIAISTYSKADIREHWISELKNKFSDLYPKTQIICSEASLNLQWENGNPASSSKTASKSIPLTIFIPQSVRGFLGFFDIIIIDEAHEYLEVKNISGMLKKIIKRHSHSKTKILGLSATGFDLIKSGAFFEKASKIFYDVPTALNNKIIVDCSTSIEHFSIEFKPSHFNISGDLNRSGIKQWVKQFGVKKTLLLEKLQTVIKKINTGKTLIIVPGGVDPKTKVGKELEICQFINERFGYGKQVAVVKSSRYSIEEQQKSENLFRKDRKSVV